MINNDTGTSKVTLIYDGDCPLCRALAQKSHLEKAFGLLRLIDAREHPTVLQAVMAQGYNLDQGFLVIVDNTTYFGEQALHQLALMSSRSILFNRLCYELFRYRWIATLLYPVLRQLRNLILFTTGRARLSLRKLGDEQ